MKFEKCKHNNIRPEYNHVVCRDCFGIKTDSGVDWGIARNTWFESLDYAKFYKENGRLPEKIKENK